MLFRSIGAHCSNVAVALLESEAEDFDTHEYQKSIREMNNSMYRELFEAYEMKYDINKPKKAKKVSEKVNKK